MNVGCAFKTVPTGSTLLVFSSLERGPAPAVLYLVVPLAGVLAPIVAGLLAHRRTPG